MSLATWIADHVLGARRRAAELPAEIAQHDAQAEQLQIDVSRWTSDHARKVDQEIERVKNQLAANGHLYSGAMRSGLENVLEQAQEAWRNMASDKLSSFLALARAEGEGHDRRRRSAGGPSLKLDAEALAAVASWRSRPYPVPDPNEGPLRPHDLIGEDEEIAPLLTSDGLTWEAARNAARD